MTASRLVSAKMAPLAEIYLATMWKYQPVAVKRMMDQLISGTASFEGVQLMYDAEHYWVKVNCHPDHRHGIRRLFNQISAEIEEDVFDVHSSILNGDGTVKVSKAFIRSRPTQSTNLWANSHHSTRISSYTTMSLMIHLGILIPLSHIPSQPASPRRNMPTLRPGTTSRMRNR